MTLVKFQPAPVRSFFDFRSPLFNAGPYTAPAVNVIETARGFRLELAAPGLAKEDFQVKVENDVLTVSAKKETQHTEEGVQYRRREFSYSTFERAFRLPETIDANQVSAAFENGVLRIELVKKPEAQAIVKTVEIA